MSGPFDARSANARPKEAHHVSRTARRSRCDRVQCPFWPGSRGSADEAGPGTSRQRKVGSMAGLFSPRPRCSTSADRRRPARGGVRPRELRSGRDWPSSGSGARLPGSPSRSFEPDRSEPGPAETTRCTASRSPSRRRLAAAAHCGCESATGRPGCTSPGSAPGAPSPSPRSSLRPRRLGEHRVAVVLPTLTWQAYNFRDDDGDGPRRHLVRRPVEGEPSAGTAVPGPRRAAAVPVVRPTVPPLARLERPARGLPGAGRPRARLDARRLRRAYDLIIFPGHHEYVTVARVRPVIAAYRNLGGNLMFLSANNFFWRVERDGPILRLIAMWRDLGRPEAALVGVQYVAYGEPAPRPVRRPARRRLAVAFPRHWPSERIELRLVRDRSRPAAPARRRAGSACSRRSGTGRAVRSRAR